MPFPTRFPTTKIRMKTGQVVEAECCVQPMFPYSRHRSILPELAMWKQFIPGEPIAGIVPQCSILDVINPSPGLLILERKAMIDFTSALDEWVQEEANEYIGSCLRHHICSTVRLLPDGSESGCIFVSIET